MNDHVLTFCIWALQVFQVIALIVIQWQNARIEQNQQNQMKTMLAILNRVQDEEQALANELTQMG